MDIVKLLKSCISSNFQHVYTYDDDWNVGFSLVYIQRNENFADVGNGATELKLVHNKLWSKLKKLGYIIQSKKIGTTSGYIDYYYNGDDIDVEFIGQYIRIASSTVPSSNMDGQSVVTIVVECWSE